MTMNGIREDPGQHARGARDGGEDGENHAAASRRRSGERARQDGDELSPVLDLLMAPRGISKEFRRRLAAVRRFLLRAESTTAHARERSELKELAAAEARLDAGVFGLCVLCGRPIALARLRASPTVRRCARCAVPQRRRR
jgi:hypothetical protein